MPQLSVASPVGTLTLTEEEGKITRLDWGRAEREEPTPLLRRAKAELTDYFKGRRQTFTLPLAPKGTPFQQKVWQRMRQIPYGKTQSYGAIAGKLHSGPRAVGGAAARNPIPILIPCHRVLGAQGTLGGYSAHGGVATKRALLALEGVTRHRRGGPSDKRQ